MKFNTHKDLIKAIHRTLGRSGLSRKAYPEFFVSGGSLIDIEKKRPINDVDIYFRNEDEFNKFKCIMDDLSSAAFINRVEFISDTQNAITYRVGDFLGYRKMIIQIIRTRFGDPEDLIDSNDLSVVRRYLDCNGDAHECKSYSREISISFDALSDQSLPRLFKYQSKGFELSVSQVREVIEEISKRDQLFSYYELENVSSDGIIFKCLSHIAVSTFTCSEKLELIRHVRDIFQKRDGNCFIIKDILQNKIGDWHWIMESLGIVMNNHGVSTQDLIRGIGEDLALELILYRNKYSIRVIANATELEKIVRSKFPEHFI